MELKKQVKDYERLYELSDTGIITNSKGVILKTQISTCGYVIVSLSKNGKQKGFTLHRLLAIHFVNGRTIQKNQVNHINGVKTDNRIENLEWVTPSSNIVHSFKNGMSKIVKGKDHWFSKPVISLNTVTQEVVEYGSLTEAASMLCVTPAAINYIIKNNGITRGKLKFSYI